MLVQICVRDFAIVRRLELPMGPGMSVLTGETGAGKSILVDALGLALGQRAERGMVRAGAERAEVSAVFDVGGVAAARQWLAEQELEADEPECMLRRTLGSDGRSRAWINGRPVPVQMLREVGELLVDIHGQHAHQSLLRHAARRQILDDYGGHQARLERVAALQRRWAELARSLAEFDESPAEREQRLELLRYQAQELRALDVQPGEPEALEAEHRRLAHASELLDSGRAALECLCGESEAAASARVAAARRLLEGLLRYDPELRDVTEMIDSAAIHLDEAASELHRRLEALELDPARYAWLEQRVGAIHDLARKHRVLPEELPALLERAERELEGAEHGAGRRDALQRELQEASAAYADEARALHDARARAAAALGEAVTANMQGLGMSGGRCQIVVEHLPHERPSPGGLDRVELLVSTDPGQPLQPLARVASGGELSRISLAIQVVVSEGSGAPTLIFDEVDAGIGGRVAEIVGQQLRTLGRHRQVLCITHLPQVASQATHHIHVHKRSVKAQTETRLEALSGDDRVREIARMLGGLTITEQTLAHAREMLERA